MSGNDRTPAARSPILAPRGKFDIPDPSGEPECAPKTPARASILRFESSRFSVLLRQAIEAGAITPVFQPLLDLRTRQISGFEMLARWYDPGLGYIPPDTFIPVADAEGLLTSITAQLLSKACEAAAGWPGEVSLAINISPRQLEEQDLAARIAAIAREHRFPLERLEIEITEQALPGDLNMIRSTVDQLKTLGMTIVMDDFGVGHASLSRLNQLPFDKIKIDRSFVDALGDGPEGPKIIAAIISLGLSLGVTTVAEGVEDHAQADMLTRLGCAVSQGWLYGRPVPAQKVPELLRTARELVGEESRPPVPPPAPSAPLEPAARLAQMEVVFDAAPVGLALLDLDFRYITVNPFFARLYRLEVADFLGRTVKEVLPGPAAQILAHLERALVAEAVVDCEIVLDNEEGNAARRRTYLRTAQPFRDAAGAICGLSVALRDITERKNAEARLRESEEDLRHTVELNPHMPWTCSPAGEILSISPCWQALTGGCMGDLAGRGWVRLLHPEDRARVRGELFRAIRTGEPLDTSCRVSLLHGGWRWMRARAYPRRDALSRILRWYGTVEDIHDRKLVEAALLLKTERLEEATQKLAMHAREDHLTGLANRRHLDETLEREVSRVCRAGSGGTLSVIMVDVDHFKSFNDTCGHLAGDECLRSVAGVLNSVLHRRSDLAARFGGEEFVIVLPHTAEEGAMQVARSACEAVRALQIPHPGSALGVVTISAGIAVLSNQERDTVGDNASRAQKLLQTADFALYAAKTSGRDRVVSASTLAPD